MDCVIFNTERKGGTVDLFEVVMAELGLDDGQIEEQLAAGIMGILSPAVLKVDANIVEVRLVFS